MLRPVHRLIDVPIDVDGQILDGLRVDIYRILKRGVSKILKIMMVELTLPPFAI